MQLSRYRFRSDWVVDASFDPVFDVLADIATYPEWWPQVRAVDRIDDDSASVVVRSALPYDLRVRVARAQQDRSAGVLEARLSGDLDGWCRWTLTPRGSRTGLVYEQQVVAHRRTLRVLGLVGRPALRLNHAWMMRRGRRGLERRIARLVADG